MEDFVKPNNTEAISVEEPVVTETRKCKVCGEVLPITMFKAFAGKVEKRAHVCNKCRCDGTSDKSSQLSVFTSRELIIELRNRGYSGELSYTTIKKVKI